MSQIQEQQQPQINIEFLQDYENLFHSFDTEFKKLLSNETINGSITLNKEIWTFKELLEWCIQTTEDNIKLMKQIRLQLEGKELEDQDVIHEEIRQLKSEGLNLKYMKECCVNFGEDLKEFLKEAKQIKNSKQFLSKMPKIYVEMSHYRLFIDKNIYFYILKADQNDIMMFMDDKNGPHYQLVKQRLEYINILATPEEVKKALLKFCDLNNLANCTIQKTFSKEQSTLKPFKELFWIIYYFFSPKQAEIETKVFQVNPCNEQVIEIWNLFSRIEAMKQFLKVSIPAITYHKKIYVPPVFQPITLEEIVQRNKSNTMFTNLKPDEQNLPQPIFNRNQQENINSANVENNNSSTQQVQQRLSEADQLTNKKEGEEGWKDFDIYDKKSQNSIKVRILSNVPLIPRKQNNGDSNKEQKKEKECKVIEEIVYHIHGGGWVGLNTFSHQMYTRKWAKQLVDIPIFSVEYSKAPENKYPKPLDDCWQVYQFLLNGVQEYFENIKVKKIIIAGDSAGGNMALGICLLALQRGLRLPDGLVLSYPALNIRNDFFTPSYVNIKNEIIVPYNFLMVSLDSYMDRTNPNVDPSTDPLLSPLLFTDEVLALLPPIRIGCGDKDILRDDCIRFLYRLIKLNHNAKMILYRELTHGYLNLDIPMTLPATYKCGYDCGLFIKQLLAKEQLPPIIN